MDNAIEGYNYLTRQSVDIVFLDVHMPELNGLDLLKSLNKPVNVIFTTSDRDKAIDAFEYHALDYIIKPISYVRFLKAVNRAQKLINLQKKANGSVDTDLDVLFVKDGNKLIKLAVQHILFIEARGDYAALHTDSKSYLIHTSLKGITEKLTADVFVKVHRSYVANLRHITDIDEQTIQVGSHRIPLSKAKRDLLLKQLRVV